MFQLANLCANNQTFLLLLHMNFSIEQFQFLIQILSLFAASSIFASVFTQSSYITLLKMSIQLSFLIAFDSQLITCLSLTAKGVQTQAKSLERHEELRRERLD